MTETESKPSLSAQVLCPICLDNFTWPNELFVQVVEGGTPRWTQVDLSGHTNDVKRLDRRSRSYVRCPNPSKDGTPEHYLPIAHRDYGKPVVIGLVGRANSGKTHLLVAMLAAALRGDLSQFGLTFEPADSAQHKVFTLQLDRFLSGRRLEASPDFTHQFAEYVLVRNREGTVRPLVFFDVAGEDFVDPSAANGRAAQFVLGASALMFVDDPERAMASRRLAPEGASRENPAFLGAVTRLRSRKDMRELPVAVVLSKSDELRYEHPVDHWLRRDDLSSELLAKQFRDESRDVYAFLDRGEARSMLSVFEAFDRGTLHFVSATGGAGDKHGYPRGVRPVRVLQPLVALLAMTGVIDGPEARKVGR